MHPETRVVHVVAPVPAAAGSRPMAVPLYQTSSFAFDDPAVLADSMTRPDGAFVYSRMTNPTVRALEETVAALENGAAALATSSGMGAINLLLHGLLRSGDHVVAQRSLYGGTYATLQDLSVRYGIGVTYISGHDAEELRAAIRPTTRVLYLETISNPTGHVSDLPALAPIARAAGVLTVVDNTFATPLLGRPIEQGADIVVHSATKYLGGHSDVTGGLAVFADEDRYREMWEHAVEFGAAADPFAAWLTLRGMQTLPLRMRRHEENAAVVAGFLNDHPAVAAVRWTGLADHPSHAVASRFLSGFGATFCFDLAGGYDAAVAFSTKIGLISLAPSLGGTGTVLMHPASTSHRQLDEDELAAAGIGTGMIRIAVGIEHPDDLLADLGQAL
ncbi:aminotransferase class I/II-fold pyridoxal phosphate-dependent enzyme [Actinoplanes sp. NPDC026619]|uniref:trans-sulfuration enzyme family protein n=1 Tax=Actinoplanes sp. NPDC026619 TaxID=3155798 RepID=UPI0033E90FA2